MCSELHPIDARSKGQRGLCQHRAAAPGAGRRRGLFEKYWKVGINKSIGMIIYGISMEYLWNIYGISMEYIWLLMTGWWLTKPLWKIWVRQLGWYMMTFPIYGNIKNVPNHQPVFGKQWTSSKHDLWNFEGNIVNGPFSRPCLITKGQLLVVHPCDFRNPLRFKCAPSQMRHQKHKRNDRWTLLPQGKQIQE